MHNVIPTREPTEHFSVFWLRKKRYQFQYLKGILLYSWMKNWSQRQRFCTCINSRGYFHPKIWGILESDYYVRKGSF